jgi:carboxyl-terminal processing protease
MRLPALLLFCFSLFQAINLHAQSANTTINRTDTAVTACIQRASRLLDEAFVLMQKNYYRKDSVQWDQLAGAAKERLLNARDCATADETLQWCFRQMKEKHSFVMPAVKAAIYNGNINSSAEPRSASQLIGQLKYELVEEGIAYIDLPWVSTADQKICTAFADSLQQIIASFDKQGVTKWIIDLRNNTGGNCWPMLTGLGPLLGNGIHGYFVSATEKIPFSYKDGTMMQGKYSRCTASNPYTLSNPLRNIVILTGPNTASAGEIVALAFKGRQQVTFFGEPTAGLTTANTTYKLSDGSMLVLTVCKEADRHGNIYEGRLQPDRLIPRTGQAGKDVARTSALMYLQMD